MITPIAPTLTEVSVLLEKQLHCVILIHPERPLAAQASPLSIEQIPKGEFIGPIEAFLTARCEDRSIMNAIKQRIHITIGISLSAVGIVRQRMGVALIDPFTASFFAKDMVLVVKTLHGAPLYPFTLIQPKRLIASKLQSLFQKGIEEELESFIAKNRHIVYWG